MIYFSFLIFFWFARSIKSIFFWLYLWQLKEYHIGRFLDHFRTAKGKELLFNKLLGVKLLLLAGIFIYPEASFYVLSLVYFLELVKALTDALYGKLRRPVSTSKILLLIAIILAIEIIFAWAIFSYPKDFSSFISGLLIFDILLPIVVSVIVLALQPLVVLGRNRIIKKARIKREKFKDLMVVGITGSYGKTSTKEMLYTILSEKFKVLKTKEHQNSEIGISQCILNELRPEHQIFICEMGAYNRGGIKLLCSIAEPKIGILTGINEQHMATFGSQENIIKGKYELIESLPQDGIAFFNGKNRYCRELYEKTKIKKILYATIPCEAGRENILGVIAVAEELGMSSEEIGRGIKKVKDKIPGIQIKNGINGLKILNATYSSNPDGVAAHLEGLRRFPGKKIIIMPCLIELGKASGEVHRKIGRKIGEVCDLAIITTKDRFKEIKDGAGEKVIFMERPEEIFEKIKSFTREGDIVLLESRVSHSMNLTNQLIRLLTP
ncbi:MAG: Mur ligase family protein [bacterium]|nr:Mur ligase family protein [bacterium]